MPTSPTTRVIEHLRRTVLREGAGLGDGELLGRFLERHDEASLAALVRRHGPMVWGVCRRLLGHHDAEDAFQATFLVLVRKAASIRPRVMVGNWLYGVAHQTALQARRTGARRRAREVQVTLMPDTEAVQQDQWHDVKPLLDQELSRLPDIYRTVVVLCDLEGRTRKEVAYQLGVPEGTVAGRLARARTMLAKSLAQRGVVLSGGTLAAVLAHNVASAGVPASVVSATISAASLVAAGQLAAAGPVSVKVAALAEGVLKAMMIAKLKAALAIVLVLGFVVTGATMLTSSLAMVQAQQPPAAVAPAQEPPKEEKEAFTAWGKEVGGLQAGLGFHPGQARPYAPGETIKLVVRVRNVGKDEVKFRYSKETFFETPPSVTDGEGKFVPLKRRTTSGFVALLEATLGPGKEIELAEVKLEPRTATQSVHEGQWNLFTTGKFSVWYDQLADPANDKALSKIATGKLDLEIKFEAPRENEKNVPPQQKGEEDKEAFTAWGKEINGLQAGLGYRRGSKRSYHFDERVMLVARIRNLTKESLEFEHIWAFFVENAPKVIDPAGKVVQLPRILAEGLHGPRSTKVPPGKDVALYEWEFDLDQGWRTNHGPGTFLLQCERFVGPTSFNPNHPNPKLAKLATGKLELEVKEEEKEAFTSWGNEINGLQAGLGFRSGAKRAYSHGETVPLVVRVRNVGKENVKFQYLKEFFMEKPPSVTGGEAKTIRFGGTNLFGRLVHIPVDVNLAPGKEMELHDLKLKLEPARDGGDVTEVSTEALHGKGKFQVQYEQLAAASIDPNLTKLATGKLELEVKEAQKQEKEAFTAWGNEVSGLQAGLGFRPGAQRAYSHGETVPLVVRVRNVSKEDVRFEYIKEFIRAFPPAVTDAKGKPIFQRGEPISGRTGSRVEVNLAPGMEIELGEWKLVIGPEFGTGKVQIQYERVFPPSKEDRTGSSRLGLINLDPTGGKLATGKLALETKADPPRVSDKSITIQVVIEKVNAGSRAITASCVALGLIDGERKPLRLENLSVSIFAKVRINGKERALADLKAGTDARLELDGRESTLTVIGIEAPDDRLPAGLPEGAPNKE